MLGRYLATNGLIGEIPWYYPIFKAAKECNCTPWELLEQSVFWQDAAIKVLSGEESARKILASREK